MGVIKITERDFLYQLKPTLVVLFLFYKLTIDHPEYDIIDILSNRPVVHGLDILEVIFYQL